MAVTHPTTVRNGIADYVVDLIDAGAGAGTIEIQTGGAGGTQVATLTFSDPAFGAASSGVATANAITDDSNATGNASAVDAFQVKDSNGTVVFQGAVSTSGSDINLSSTTIAASDTVSLSSLTYTAPA